MLTQNIDYVIQDFRIKTKSYTNYTMNTCHFHDAYEIYYLNQGSRQCFINNQTYTINAGSLVIIPPYLLHKTMDTGIPHSRLLLSFRPIFLTLPDTQALIKQFFSEQHVLQLPSPMQHQVETLFNTLIQEITLQEPFFIMRIQLLLSSLLVDIARYIHNMSTPSTKNSCAQQRIYHVIDYLKGNYKTKISLHHLSQIFFISPYYLSRSFKKITGVTVNKYIQQLRIIEGQRLLKETTHHISFIADELGYGTLAAFDKQFKAYTNQTPKEYRHSLPKQSLF